MSVWIGFVAPEQRITRRTPMATRTPQLTIDVSGIYDDETLHEYLWKTLDLPGDYGCDWNSFAACIRSDARSQMPQVLRVTGLAELRRFAPGSATQLETRLAEYAREFPDRSVVHA